MDKKYLLSKYGNQKLGVHGDGSKIYFVSDFLDIAVLANFVADCWGSADRGLTKAGVEFLEEAFGWEIVFSEITKRHFSNNWKGKSSDGKDITNEDLKKEIEEWWLEKREIALKYGCM